MTYIERRPNVLEAELVDLPAFIQARYNLRLKRDGIKAFKCKDPKFRLFVSKMNYKWATNGNIKGSAINTVRALDEILLNHKTSHKEAVDRINDYLESGGIPIDPELLRSTIQCQENFNPSLGSLSAADKGKVIAYIKNRGLSYLNTFGVARAVGFCDFATDAKGNHGIAFLGTDAEGKVKSTEVRLIKPISIDGDIVKSMCRRGSDKSYVPVFPGTLPEVHITEGGFSALACHEIYMRKHGAAPTIIMSGGKDNRGWLQHEHLDAFLLPAEKIVIWSENEATPEKQQLTDNANEQMRHKIVEELGMPGERVKIKRPPEKIKDLADWNRHV